MRGQERKPHDARSMAESFGADPERYDRLRPSYPDVMVETVVADMPGRDVLDVGCGTGLASRPFQAAGCSVLGVEPDVRMAEFARERGLEVAVARFEEWDSADRTFDALISGTTWHWIDPVAGALKAAELLRVHGVLAVFWNVQHLPAELLAAVNAVYERVTPGSPFAKQGPDSHSRILNRADRGIRDSGSFSTPRIRRFRWEQPYTREQWLELVPTFGGHSLLAPDSQAELLSGLGDAIDAAGGSFTMTYETLLLSAARV